MNPQQTQLDKDVKNLVSAMGRVETGDPTPDAYKKRGASGEFGRYQYMPDTWKKWASESGISTPLEQSTIEEQNKVAYDRVKRWKDEGYNPAQIASMWNSGDPDAYKKGHVGTNQQGVAYNTPEHVRKVSEAYQQVKGGTYTPPPQTEPFKPAPTSGVQSFGQQIGAKEGGLISDVSESLGKVGQGVGSAYERAATGVINPASGVLQGAGALAGGVGDVVDDALSNIPVLGKVYEGATDLIGGAVSGAMQTAPGQAATNWFEGLSPETQGNIGAALNVASVVPMFKALKFGKQGVGDAITSATQNKVRQKAVEEIEGSLTRVPLRSLERAKSRGLDPMAVLIDEPRYLPDVIEVNGKFLYDTKEGSSLLQQAVDIDEEALQKLLASKVKQKGGAQILGFNINDVRERTIKDVLSKQGLTGGYTGIKKALNDYFDALDESLKASSGRNYISLNELNDIKRDIRNAINFDAMDPTGTLAKQAKFDAGQSLMGQIEDAAKKAGIEGVPELNKAMGNKLQALDILEALGGKTIKTSSRGKDGLIKSVAKTIPGVEGIVDYVTRGAPLTPTRKLKRKRPIQETTQKGLIQLGTGLGLSGQLQSEE